MRFISNPAYPELPNSRSRHSGRTGRVPRSHLDTAERTRIVSAVIVYAIVDLRSSPDHPLGDAVETFVRREDAERFIEEVRGNDSRLPPAVRDTPPPRAVAPQRPEDGLRMPLPSVRGWDEVDTPGHGMRYFIEIVRIITTGSRPLTVLAVAGTFALVGASAGAAPTAVDVVLEIGAATQRSQNPAIVPNGGTVTVTSLNFVVSTAAELITPQPASVTVRFELAQGLSWGTNRPDREGCTYTATSGECPTPELQPITGRTGWGWEWDAVAERPGSYVLKSAIIAASEPDPDPSNDSASITVVVSPSTGGGSGGGGSGGAGGSAAVSASAAKVSPAKAKAGKPVTATVRVTRGGTPVRPTKLGCKGTIGKAKIKGKGKAARGSATCVYRTAKSAKGKTLRGTMSFSALGKKFTKRFAKKLG